MAENTYYGTQDVHSVSYLEFGSMDLAAKSKKIWAYWQDEEAYDLYMFARYARDLLAFRKLIENKKQLGGVKQLDEAVKRSAHDKLMDYILKYVGMLAIDDGGAVCESGSSLWGWIEEAQACDIAFHGGAHLEKIHGFHYVGSDLSRLMNDGAQAFHADYQMDFSTAPTIADMLQDIQNRIVPRLALFYGLSVSIRYAVRKAEDLVGAARCADLCVYNRLSLSLAEDKTLVYGTGKTVYVVSLDELTRGLKALGASAYFCTANMQYERDGKETVRASIIVSKDKARLDRFIAEYQQCIGKSKGVANVEDGRWMDLEELHGYVISR